MAQCAICQKSGDISLLQTRHKELGNIYVCRDCWTDLYTKNKMVNSGSGSCGSGSSGGSSCSCCR